MLIVNERWLQYTKLQPKCNCFSLRLPKSDAGSSAMVTKKFILVENDIKIILIGYGETEF